MPSRKPNPWRPWCHAPSVWSVVRYAKRGGLEYFKHGRGGYLRWFEARRIAREANGATAGEPDDAA